MNGVYRLVDIRTLEIVRLGCSHDVSANTLRSVCNFSGLISTEDYVLQIYPCIHWNHAIEVKKRFQMKYGLAEPEDCELLPAVTDEEEMQWIPCESTKDAFCSETGILLILGHLKQANLYRIAYQHYQKPEILDKIRIAFCHMMNEKNMQDKPKEEYREEEKKLLFQNWKALLLSEWVKFRTYPASFLGMTKLHRKYSPDFCTADCKLILNGNEQTIPLFITICPERNLWRKRSDFCKWFGDNKQIADEYALSVLFVDNLPDTRKGICKADFYRNHKLFKNCNCFISNRQLCVMKTGEEFM
ncbi:MAG: hypothetical protein IKI37_10100 [Oscillospiraceae bacterium]|nr:hypothetical protein [Oscillospiraceae bacterium]